MWGRLPVGFSKRLHPLVAFGFQTASTYYLHLALLVKMCSPPLRNSLQPYQVTLESLGFH